MVERATRRETAEITQATRAGAVVHIGCNLPNGLELQIYALVPSSEMTPQGPRETKRSVKVGAPVRLRGIAVPFGKFPTFPIVNGYAVTVIPQTHWDKWCEQNQDAALLENRCLIAGADLAEVQAKAAECRQDKVKSGMEPVDPKKPPSVGGGLKVEPAIQMT